MDFQNTSEQLSLDDAQKQMWLWSISCKNITTLSCLHISRCGDLQSTWETCGFGIRSCRACQQCWLDVRCWCPSCSPPRAQARFHQAPAPEPQKGRAEVNQRWNDTSDETTQAVLYQLKLHRLLSETSETLCMEHPGRARLSKLSLKGKFAENNASLHGRWKSAMFVQLSVESHVLLKHTRWKRLESEIQPIVRGQQHTTDSFQSSTSPVCLPLLIYNGWQCSLVHMALNVLSLFDSFLENT